MGLPQQLHFKRNPILTCKSSPYFQTQFMTSSEVTFVHIFCLASPNTCSLNVTKNKLAWKERLAKIWQKPGSNDPRIKGCANPTLGGQQVICVLGSNICRDG
jgi:hypothetical protein